MKEILSNVIEIIFAEHYPAVLSIFPHWNPPEPSCWQLSRQIVYAGNPLVFRHRIEEV
jgi:hypothetical protein